LPPTGSRALSPKPKRWRETELLQWAPPTSPQQYLRAGLLDEIHLNLVPLILDGGVRLIDHLERNQVNLECTRVVESSGVTHLRSSVRR
jgi:hypothetical protein